MQSSNATAISSESSQPDVVFESILDGRFSCRAYEPRSVPREVIERILRLAARTASWCNSQPWHVEITTGAATDAFRQALLEHVTSGSAAPDVPFPAQYTGIYQERRRECGFQLYEAVGVARGDREASRIQALKNFELFGAPHVAIITSEADLGPYGAVDCGAYVSNFMLAAQSCGVASIAQAALAGYSPFIRQYFSIPDNRKVVCGISFGYADMQAAANLFRTRRADIAQTTTWHTE